MESKIYETETELKKMDEIFSESVVLQLHISLIKRSDENKGNWSSNLNLFFSIFKQRLTTSNCRFKHLPVFATITSALLTELRFGIIKK